MPIEVGSGLISLAAATSLDFVPSDAVTILNSEAQP
jgi:hypothetical protein